MKIHLELDTNDARTAAILDIVFGGSVKTDGPDMNGPTIVNEPVLTPGQVIEISDSAKKLIDEKNVDVNLVTGTGKNGKINLVDVQRHLKALDDATPNDQPAVQNAQEDVNPNFKEHTVDDVKDKIRALINKDGGSQERALEIVAEFNAPNVTGLFPEQYPAVIARVDELLAAG